jgi:hypothetical protein
MNLATRQRYVQTAVGVVLDAVQYQFARSCPYRLHPAPYVLTFQAGTWSYKHLGKYFPLSLNLNHIQGFIVLTLCLSELCIGGQALYKYYGIPRQLYKGATRENLARENSEMQRKNKNS